MHSPPDIIICIPAFNEDSLIETLESLKNAIVPEIPVGIILVFNCSSDDPKEVKVKNVTAYEESIKWSKREGENFYFKAFIYNDLDPKKAGVGMARKLAMDEGARIFEEEGKDGIILALDADCTVQDNYFREIWSFFSQNPSCRAANLYFEHRFSDQDADLREMAIQYELHLRYFKQAQKYINFPFAYHTVGSSMAVRSQTYIKSKGMNVRKAGEDFYFLQKLFSQYEFGEINNTCVYPKGRYSDRVPFGTGAALLKAKKNENKDLTTYSFSAFQEIAGLIKLIHSSSTAEDWKKILNSNIDSKVISEFLIQEKFKENFEKVILNAGQPSKLTSHFFRWFNNFKLLKCLNYLRDTQFPSGSVLDESSLLLEAIGIESPSSSLDMLAIFRNLDKLNQTEF